MRTPLFRLNIDGNSNVYLKDESSNPTNTFKDRLAELAISSAVNPTLFASISYGNTAVSFAHRLSDDPNHIFLAFVPNGFKNFVFGPSSFGTFIKGQDYLNFILSKKSHVIEVDLMDQILRPADLKAMADMHGIGKSLEFCDVTEGLEQPAYAAIVEEALMQMPIHPDYCVIQFGAGILANETIDVLRRICRHTKIFPISTPDPESIAKMLFGPIWVDSKELRRDGFAPNRHQLPDRTGAVRPPYKVFLVTEDAIEAGLKIASDNSISAEPSGAASLGFVRSLRTIDPNYSPSQHSVLLVNTGNGIDYIRGHSLNAF